MIPLNRTNKTPSVLLNRGHTATQENRETYIRNRDAYDSGELKFSINKNIYGSQEVRNALRALQHDKCCYCEQKTSPGRIDHFRPKGAVRQDKGSDRLHPGYYWLAYQWDNLVFACEACNLKKSDYFPLEEPAKRAMNHLDPLASESPLLLNPYHETDLSEHLTFAGSACKPETKRGRVTVAVLRLNRPELQDRRLYELGRLAILCEVVRDAGLSHAVRRDATCAIQSFRRPEAPYSAMARDFLRAAHGYSEDVT